MIVMKNVIYPVILCVLIIAVLALVAFVKRGRSKKSAERDRSAQTSVTYEIKSTFAKTELYNEDTDGSALRCAVCDTIIPDGSAECPNCGTTVQMRDAGRKNITVENRKIELDIISDAPAHEKTKTEGVSSSSSKKSGGPVMIGSLKSTMGGSKSKSADND